MLTMPLWRKLQGTVLIPPTGKHLDTGENRISSSAAGCQEELGSNTGEGEGAQTQNKSGRDPQLGGSLRGQWLSQVPPLLELEGTLPCGTEAHPDSSARWSCSLALATLCEQAAPVKASSRPSGSGDVANKAGEVSYLCSLHPTGIANK